MSNNNSFNQESQFELINQDLLNSKAGKNRLPEPGTTGQIETLSENLIVAPASGQQNGDSLLNNQIKQLPNSNVKLSEAPIDIFNSRNSIVSPVEPTRSGFDLMHGRGSDVATSSNQSYFERLSSIELLFLISSLMFLILLALGLASSFYCFRRQTGQSKQNRASAILRRKQRYLNSLDHRHNHGSSILISPPTILQPQQGALNYSRQRSSLAPRSQHHLKGQQGHLQHHHRHTSTNPPSPESDLSERNLLESIGSQRYSGSGGGGQDNQAYLFSPLRTGPTTAYATPDNQARHYQPYTMAGRSTNYQFPVGHKQQIAANEQATSGLLVKQAPVVGRRDTQQYGYSFTPALAEGTVAGRKQRHLSPRTTTTAQYPTKPHKWPPSFNESNLTHQTHVPHSDSLLAPIKSALTEEPEYLNTRSLRFKNMNEHQVATGASLAPAKYAFVNKARAKLSSGPIAAKHQQLYNPSENLSFREGAQSQLWRAKSLSAVNQDEARAAGWLQRTQTGGAGGSHLPLGGTLSRHDHSGGANNYRRRQLDSKATFGGLHSILAEERFGRVKYGARMGNKGLLMREAPVDSTDESFDDEDEHIGHLREPNNNISQILKRDKSKIVLKSIEDAYITNLTEIEEQEYMKRDSTRPLGLEEWRAVQPRARIQVDLGSSKRENSESPAGRLVSTQTTATSDEEDEEQRYQSTGATNLRSLTELDVNFAKSLPALAATSAPPPDHGLSLRPAASADRLIGVTENEEQSRKQRSNSYPEVGASGSGDNNTRRHEEGSSGRKEAQENRGESPDLILSPEYDYNRLEFEPPGEANKSSHNSVSYV